MTALPPRAAAGWRRRAALLGLAGLGCVGLASIGLAIAGGFGSAGESEPSATAGHGPAGPVGSGTVASSAALAITSAGLGLADERRTPAGVSGPSANGGLTNSLASTMTDALAVDPGAGTLLGVEPRARVLVAGASASIADGTARLAALDELEAMGFRAAAEKGYADILMGSVAASAAPTRRAAAVALARLALADGDGGRARAALVAVAGEPPDFGLLPPEGSYLYGLALEKLGHEAGALAAYQHFAATSPAMAGTAQMAIGQAAFALGSYALAADAYTKARDQAVTPSGQFLGALRRGNALLRVNAAEGRAAYEDALRRAVSDTDRAQALAGLVAAAADDAEATRWRRRLVAEFPATVLAASALGKLIAAGEAVPADQQAMVKAGTGDLWGALALLDAAVKADPAAPAAWRLQIIRWYAAVGQRDQAVSDADAFLAERPDDALAVDVTWESARALANLDRPAEAVTAFGMLAERWPDDARAPGALWQRAWLIERADGVLPAAEAFDALARRYPNAREAADARFRAALNYWRAGRLPKAAELWTASLDRPVDAADKARAAYWLGRAAVDNVDQGSSPVAERYFQTALSTEQGGFYAVRAASRLGGAGAGNGPVQVAPLGAVQWAAQTAGPDAPAQLADWLATWSGQSRAAALATRERVKNSDGLQRASMWLAVGDGAAARQAVAAERERIGADPAALMALALESMRLGLVDAGMNAAEAVWSRAPSAARQSAPLVVPRLVYPAPWAEWVLAVAAAHHLPPARLYALIRQESRFLPAARSGAGARGLTQVMPATGAQIAGQLGLPFAAGDLDRPYVALELGAWYLADQAERFGAPQPWPALAAYNGGPGNARRWQKAAGDDLDLYVELIDIGETRTYVKRIAEHEAMYAKLYAWP